MNRLASTTATRARTPRADLVRIATCAWTLVTQLQTILQHPGPLQLPVVLPSLRALCWLAGALPEAMPGLTRAHILQGPTRTSEIAATVSLSVLRELCGHGGKALSALQSGLLSSQAATRRHALEDLALAHPWLQASFEDWAPLMRELVRLDRDLAGEALPLVLLTLPDDETRDELLDDLVKRTPRLSQWSLLALLQEREPLPHAHHPLLAQTLLALVSALSAVPDDPSGQQRLDALLDLPPSFDASRNQSVLYAGRSPGVMPLSRVWARLHAHPLWQTQLQAFTTWRVPTAESSRFEPELLATGDFADVEPPTLFD